MLLGDDGLNGSEVLLQFVRFSLATATHHIVISPRFCNPQRHLEVYGLFCFLFFALVIWL